MALIRPRATAGPLGGLVLSLVFAAVLLPVATLDFWLYDKIPGPHEPAPVTYRTPDLALFHNTGVHVGYERRTVIVPRGTTLDNAEERTLLTEYSRDRRPPGPGLLIGLGLAFLLAGVLYTSYLRNFGYRGNLLRTQIALCATLVAFVGIAKTLLMLTPLSAYFVPVAVLAIPIAIHLDRQVAFSTTVIAALLVGTLVPFDLTLSTVLLVQGFAAVLTSRRARRRREMILAGLVGGFAAAGTFVAIEFLASGRLPYEDWHALTESGLWGCVVGGLSGGLVSYLFSDLIELALGNVPKAKLYELADLENPLLKQIAKNAPGTWAHSLAMANLAEIAANAIGANALLTRVGAYYHDLGKSVQPRYYIENLHAGDHSPHEDIEPDVSADAIFAHCTEGVKMGRKAGLPEPIIDFMHMHHGNGLLEYFWVKNLEAGNPKHLDERDFRYPGVPPQTRETAILAICDAVEAASRTFKPPVDQPQIEKLVQRIIFGKLRLGQFDQSGLTLADLRRISAALIDALMNSFHARIEYQWQRDERQAAREEEIAALALPASVVRVEPPPPPAVTTTGPLPALLPRNDPTHPFRLDSADAPRPYRINGDAPVSSPGLVRVPVPAPEPEPHPAPAAADPNKKTAP